MKRTSNALLLFLLAMLCCLLLAVCFVVTAVEGGKVFYVDTSLPSDSDTDASNTCESIEKPCTVFSKAFSGILAVAASLDSAEIRLTWSCGLSTLPEYSSLTFNTTACDISNSIVSAFDVYGIDASSFASAAELVALTHVGATHALRLPFKCGEDMYTGLAQVQSLFPLTIGVDTTNLVKLSAFEYATRIAVLLDGSRGGCEVGWNSTSSESSFFSLAHADVSNIIWTNINPPSSIAPSAVSIINLAADALSSATRLSLSNVGFVNVGQVQPLSGLESNGVSRELYLQDVIAYNYTAQAMTFDRINTIVMQNVRLEMLQLDLPQQQAKSERLTAVTVADVKVLNMTQFSMTGCYLASCFQVLEFGSMFVDDSTFSTLQPTAKDGAVVLSASDKDSAVTIQGTYFQKITARLSPLILQGYYAANIRSCMFEDVSCMVSDPVLLEKKGGGALSSEDAVRLTITGTQFINTLSLGYGGAIFSTSLAPLIIQDSSFTSNTAMKDGGSIMQQNGRLHITRTTFSSGNAMNGACIAMSHVTDNSESASTIDFCDFSGCFAGRSGGGLYLQEALQTTITNTNFLYCTSNEMGAIMYVTQSIVSVNTSTFGSSSSGKGGLLQAQDYAIVSIDYSTVADLQAIQGGVIGWSGSGILSLTNSVITKSESLSYGGVALFDYAFASTPFIGITFDPIASLNSDAPDLENIKSQYGDIRALRFQNLTVENVLAYTFGDLLYCFEAKCLNAQEQQQAGVFSINFTPIESTTSPADQLYSATDAKKLELVGVKVYRVTSDPTSNQQIIDLQPDEEGVYSVYPSQIVQVHARVLDYFGTQIKKDYNVLARLEAMQSLEQLNNGSVQLVPSTAYLDDQTGLLQFDFLQLVGISGSSAFLNVSFMQPVTRVTVDMLIPFRIMTCPVGFVETNSQCSMCVSSYSRIQGLPCEPCPSHATCQGAYIYALDGYQVIYSYDDLPPDPQVPSNVSDAVVPFDVAYPSMDPTTDPILNFFTDEVVQCPSPSACNAGNVCSSNRTGYLCGQCVPGTSEWSGNCVSCVEGDSGNVGFLILYLLYMAAVFLVTHFSAQSQSSSSMKTLSFFTQSYLLAVGPYVEILNWARAIFAFNIFLPSNSSSSTKCPFPRDSYGRLLTEMIQPIVFLGVLVVLCICAMVTRAVILAVQRISERSHPDPGVHGGRSRSNSTAVLDEQMDDIMLEQADRAATQKQMSAMTKIDARKLARLVARRIFSVFFHFKSWMRSFVQLLIVSYAMFSNAGLSYFACKSYAGKPAVVLAATDITCYTDDFYVRGVPFILALIYSFGLPVLVIAFLVALRVMNKLQHPKIKTYFGNLFLNYRSSLFFFEAYAMIRRLSVATIVAFVGDVLTRTLVLLPLFSFFLLVQLVLRPYNRKTENLAEEVSLIGLIIMISVRGQSGFESSQAAQGVLLAIFIVVVLIILLSYVVNFWLVRLLAAKVKAALLPKLLPMKTRSSSSNELKQKEAEFMQSETPVALSPTSATSPSDEKKLISTPVEVVASPGSPSSPSSVAEGEEIELKSIDPQ